MNRPIGLVSILLCAAASASAQDKVRLDEFAVSKGEREVSIAQLPTEAPLPETQGRDRSLTVPQPSPQPRAPVDQIAKPGPSSAPTQLTPRDASRRVAPDTVSSRTDSAPGTVVRIGGRDRCDPQWDQSRLAECLRILELRAAEFNAPAPPQLSAEQKILIEQRARDEGLTSHAANMKLRYATAADPDADLQSNQELASIFLTPPPDVSVLPENSSADTSESVGEILGALGLDGTPPNPPE